MPGRLRLRLPWLRKAAEGEGTAIAEALAALDGMQRVSVRPFTGSVLCEYDPFRTDEAAIVDAVRRHTGVDLIVDDEKPVPGEAEGYARIAATEGSAIARTMARGFRELNLDLLRATGGRMSLGALVALGFLSAGVLEVARTRKIPAPPWFNLAWWSFRTFMAVEKRAIKLAFEEPQLPAPYSGPERRRRASPA